MPERPPLQFGLRTMFLATTAFAVICGLAAWLGVMIIVAIAVNAVGTFIGLWICSCAGLGFGFEDLRRELLKCFALAAIVVLSAYGLIIWTFFPYYLAPWAIVIGFVVKLFWLDLAIPGILVVEFSSLCATSMAAGLFLLWLGR